MKNNQNYRKIVLKKLAIANFDSLLRVIDIAYKMRSKTYRKSYKKVLEDTHIEEVLRTYKLPIG